LELKKQFDGFYTIYFLNKVSEEIELQEIRILNIELYFSYEYKSSRYNAIIGLFKHYYEYKDILGILFRICYMMLIE